jgi:hypothetical protein
MRDFVNIGAIGFAQLGSEDYYAKRLIEKSVLLKYIENQTEIFNIPDEFKGMCFFCSKRFPYENSSYDEIVLSYDDSVVDDWETEHDELKETTDFENDEDSDYFETKYTRFWDFVNKCESIDLETDELMEQCRLQYAETLKLSISYKKLPPIGQTIKNLKAV